MVSAEADAAAVVARIPLGDLLQLTPDDVLRLAMLLALRRGDVEAAAEHARRLGAGWKPYLNNPKAAEGAGGRVMLVNRLVRELVDPSASVGEHRFSTPAVPLAGSA